MRDSLQIANFDVEGELGRADGKAGESHGQAEKS